MQFRAAIEQDARDLQELADRAGRDCGQPDLLPALHFKGDDYAAQERQLEAAAMTLRQRWLQLAHRPADSTLKSPCDGEVAQMPSGSPVRFGYERGIDAAALER